MAKKICVPSALITFKERTGGYENFQYSTVTPQNNDPEFMFDKEEAEQMLSDANDFLQKHFPWMKDFHIIQFPNGIIRLDAADLELYSLD
ncbi:MAG: hypothetical protein HFH60_01500 [Lachnospiraceae bacterium]|nr:hypothetical protein [Lachnospiraceae bacterium]